MKDKYDDVKKEISKIKIDNAINFPKLGWKKCLL